MLQDKKAQEVIKKSYEISYALSRIGAHSSEPTLKEVLFRQAFALLESAAIENYAQMSSIVMSLEYLIQFGNTIGLIHKDNAETLLLQFAELKEIVATPGESSALPAVPLEDIFRHKSPQSPRQTANRQAAKTEPAKEDAIRQEAANEEPAKEREQEEEPSESGNNGNAAMRQAAILERIRQSGNCRLKDIQEILPHLSERTIRYDIQSLLEQNLVERVGNGGPTVYYRAR
jgi:DeoR-like helix-turn-helix domain